MTTNLENFERAFSTNSGGCRRTCNCGREFYNPDNSWSWEEGEIEGLEKKGATPVEWTVGEIEIEGKQYVPDCNCWVKRAMKIIAWMDSHNQEIALYLTFEKERKQREADRSPVVEEPLPPQ